MSTGNPLEQLRRRMQSHASPAAFASLAEEHRRAGRFADAIAVCREGLERYPGYVSARVTLGRALLDSGDPATAVEELEQAVAQAPDNLAAARALESAHVARGSAPPAPPLTPVVDLPLHETGDANGVQLDDALTGRHATGVDGPQEFGLTPDWSMPDAPSPAVESAGPADSDAGQSLWGDAAGEWATDAAATASEATAWTVDADETLEAFAHADAPTMSFTRPHEQGDEPAGIWPIPAASTDGAPVYTWADPPADGDWGPAASDAATVEAPLEATWVDESVPAAMSDDGATDVLATDPSDAPASAAAVEGDEYWGPHVGAPADETPAPFVGWGSEAPQADTSPSPWAAGADASSDEWAVHDGPSAAWALASPEEAGADSTPFKDLLDEAPAPALADEWPSDLEASPLADEPEASREAALAPPLEPEVDTAADVVAAAPDGRQDEAWAGSVRSALDEVFALAGQSDPGEPPAPSSPVVRAAMEDAAVEAAIEDTALDEETAPFALAALQQMLESVRARRAALHERS